MQPSTIEYLRHIIDEARYLMSKQKGLTRDQFIEDETVKRAFVRSIEIIGEARTFIMAGFCQAKMNISRMASSLKRKLSCFFLQYLKQQFWNYMCIIYYMGF